MLLQYESEMNKREAVEWLECIGTSISSSGYDEVYYESML